MSVDDIKKLFDRYITDRLFEEGYVETRKFPGLGGTKRVAYYHRDGVRIVYDQSPDQSVKIHVKVDGVIIHQ